MKVKATIHPYATCDFCGSGHEVGNAEQCEMALRASGRRRPRLVCTGDMVQASDWNDLVRSVNDAHDRVDETDQSSGGMLAMAAVAAAASATTRRITRRRLLWPFGR